MPAKVEDFPGPRPTALEVIPGPIPGELKKHKRWVVWKYTLVAKKWTKPPYIPSNPKFKASVKKPEDWSDFETAFKVYNTAPGIDGIGYVATPDDGLVFFDLDKCIGEDEKPDTETKAIINMLASYTEVSPSGKGIRIVARGKLPGKEINNRKLGREVYDGSGGRYLTMTGQVYEE